LVLNVGVRISLDNLRNLESSAAEALRDLVRAEKEEVN